MSVLLPGRVEKLNLYMSAPHRFRGYTLPDREHRIEVRK